MSWFGNKKEKKVPGYVKMMENKWEKQDDVLKKKKQEKKDDTLEVWFDHFNNNNVIVPIPLAHFEGTFTTQTNNSITWGTTTGPAYIPQEWNEMIGLYDSPVRKPHSPKQCSFEEGII